MSNKHSCRSETIPKRPNEYEGNLAVLGADEDFELSALESLAASILASEHSHLVEAAGRYQGAVFCEPANPSALVIAIESAVSLVGNTFASPVSWAETVDRYALAFRRPRIVSVPVDLDDKAIQAVLDDEQARSDRQYSEMVR